MTKEKGTKGGRLIVIKDQTEYQHIVEYLLGEFNIQDQNWSKDEKRHFKDKAEKFEVLHDGKDGEWPHGHVLYIKIFQSGCNVKSGLKLYVPPWKKQYILEQFHGDNKIAKHFGHNRLYKMVS